MCIGAPARVISVDPGAHTAAVESADGRVAVVSTLPLTIDGATLERGAFVVVHTGFAVAVVAPDAALAARRDYEAMR